MKEEKMLCPDCGVEMNHHANKIDYFAADELQEADEAFGGVMEEAHSCPECGRMALRAAD